MRKKSRDTKRHTHKSVSPLPRNTQSKDNLLSKRKIEQKVITPKVEESMKMCIELATHHQQFAN